MKTISLMLNAALLGVNLWIAYRHFYKDGRWDFKGNLGVFRFFTTLSNLFCAGAAGLVFFFGLFGRVPYAVWLVKYMGTLAVTVTLFTVFFFLAPRHGGVKPLLSGANLWWHLVCPLMALVGFVFFEMRPEHFSSFLLGALPVAAYGLVYLYRVAYAPAEARWRDFYGFFNNGNWQICFGVMIGGSLVLCAVFWLLSLLP